MNYPDVYSEIDANEMVYIVGGSPDYMGLFNYLIGNYLRDAVLSDARSAVEQCKKRFAHSDGGLDEEFLEYEHLCQDRLPLRCLPPW